MVRPGHPDPSQPILTHRLGSELPNPFADPPPPIDRASEDEGANAWMLGTALGPEENVLLGVTLTTGGTIGITAPEKANDDTLATGSTYSGAGVFSAGADAHWIADLGAPVYVDRSEIVMSELAPNYSVWSSEDGSDWTQRVNDSTDWVLDGSVYTGDIGGITARYWRMSWISGGGYGGGNYLAEWRLFGQATTETGWNVLAPKTIDGDDDTYETTSGPDAHLFDLGDPRRIHRVRLRIATETSGSRTYTISGANSPDLSDLTEIGTVTFTATGSEQDVNISTDNTTAYRYLVLAGNDETRNVHTFEAYEAGITDIVGVSDHGTLTGLGDDDHPQYVTHAEGDAAYAAIGHTHEGGGSIDYGEDGDISTLDYDDDPAAGTSDEVARADHVHGMPSAGEGGGGGLTQAYVGKTSAGASWESPNTGRIHLKRITLANDCLLTAVEVHVRMVADVAGGSMSAYLYDEHSGPIPGDLWSVSTHAIAMHANYVLEHTGSGPRHERWFIFPMGAWLAAGSYWIGFYNNNSNLQVSYDSGSDPYMSLGGGVGQIGDWGLWSTGDSTRDYAVRANTIR
jgi:hypothetical protein